MKTQRMRIRSVPLLPAVVTGAWAGFVPGLFIGAGVGALVSFGAGAALEWMRQLSFTTGIQQQLLPFGDRIGQLETLQDDWMLVIAVAALAVGLFSALIGLLTGAVVSATYGSILGGVDVVVETAEAPEREKPAIAGTEPEGPARRVNRRRRARRRSDSAA